MYNKKLLSQIVNNLDSRKKPSEKKDIDYVSQQGYSDNSPFRKRKSITIFTENGLIDMSKTKKPLLANGRYLPPYSGIHKFNTNVVTEKPLDEAKQGGERPELPKKKGSKGYSRSVLATNKLFTQNPLTKKPKSKKRKVFDPNAKYYQDGGPTLPEDYNQFQKFTQTLPSNLQDPEYQYGNPDQYDLYGMWETVGKPNSFAEVQDSEYFPLQDDDTYYGFTVGSDGTFLKPMSHGTTWKEVMNAHLNTNPYFQQNRIIKNEQGRLQYVPNKQKGGTKTQYYTYGKSKNQYKKVGNKWYISNDVTDFKWQPIHDPTGNRAKELNKNAKVNPNPWVRPTNTFEGKLNAAMGDTQGQSARAAAFYARPGEDDVDNLRHADSGKRTQQAIAKATGSDLLGYYGSIGLGAAHELGTMFSDPRSWGEVLQEAYEDMENNARGARMGYYHTPNATKRLNYLSKTFAMPDGYGAVRPFPGSTWTDPYAQKQRLKAQQEVWNNPNPKPVSLTEKFEKGGFQDDLGKHQKLLRDWTYGADIGMLHKAQKGKSIPSQDNIMAMADPVFYTYPGSKGVYRKINGKWEVDWNRTGNFQPLAKGDLKKRYEQLNKGAKKLDDFNYLRMIYDKYEDYGKEQQFQFPQKNALLENAKEFRGTPTLQELYESADKEDLLRKWNEGLERIAEKKAVNANVQGLNTPKALIPDSHYDPTKPQYQNYIPKPEVSESTAPFGDQTNYLQQVENAKLINADLAELQKEAEQRKYAEDRASGSLQYEQPLDMLDELWFAAATLGPGTVSVGSKALNFIDDIPIPLASKVASKMPFGQSLIPQTVGSALKRAYFTDAALRTPHFIESVEKSAFDEKPWEETGLEGAELLADYALSGVRPKHIKPFYNKLVGELKPLREGLDKKWILRPKGAPELDPTGYSTADALRFLTVGTTLAGAKGVYDKVNKDINQANDPSLSNYQRYKAGKDAMYNSLMAGINLSPLGGPMGRAIYSSQPASKLFFFDNVNKAMKGDPNGIRALNNLSSLQPIKKKGGALVMSQKQIESLKRLGYKLEELD